jgi:3-ketoacyl-CoA synthase
MSYVVSLRGLEKGDRVMQVGVGSGVKCGVNVWKVR